MTRILAFLAALLLASPALAGPIATTADLTAALKAAKGGETLALQPGTYANFGISGRDFATPVIITSADPARRAALTNFNIAKSSGLIFRRVEFVATIPAYVGFNVYEAKGITFDGISVHGSLDGDPTNDAGGISIFDSSDITVTGSEFQQLVHALAFARGSGLTATGNHIHDVESDGFLFAQAANVKISGNVIHDFHPASGDHPDAIQFMTYGTKTPSADVEISDNLIYRGAGAYTQGIFFGDEAGIPPQRVSIHDNLIVGTGWNGILTTAAADLSVARNTLLTIEGFNDTYLLVDKAAKATVSDNKSVATSVTNSTAVTNTNNPKAAKVTQAAADAAVAAWLKARTGAVEPVTPPVTPPPVAAADPRDAQIAALTADKAALVAAGLGRVTKLETDLATAGQALGVIAGLGVEARKKTSVAAARPLLDQILAQTKAAPQ